ncbi:MAG: hypothetical protein AAF211_00990 [Myxococcota bacterium]
MARWWLFLSLGCPAPESTPVDEAPVESAPMPNPGIELRPREPSFGLRPGTTEELVFEVIRTDYVGPIEITLEDPPLGILPETVTLSPTGANGALQLIAMPGVPIGSMTRARLVATPTGTGGPEPAVVELLVFVRGIPGERVLPDGDRLQVPLLEGEEPRDVVVDGQGRVVVAVAGSTDGTVLRFGLDGSPDAAFGTNGRERIGVTPRHVAVRPTGLLVEGDGTDGPRLEALTVDGPTDSAFGDQGRIALDSPAVALLAHADTIVAADVADVHAWVGDGVPAFSVGPEHLGAIDSVAFDADGGLLLAGPTSDDAWRVERRRPDGSFDPGFAAAWDVTGPVANGPGARVFAVAADARGGVALAISTPPEAPAFVNHALGFTFIGAVDPAFDEDGVVELGPDATRYVDLALLPDGRAVAVGQRLDGNDGAGTAIERNGTTKPLWGLSGSARAMAVDALTDRAWVLLESQGELTVQGFWL